MFKRLLFLIPLTLSFLFFVVCGFFVYQRYIPLTVSAAPVSESITAFSPQTFAIPDLDISVPIFPAQISNFRWEYSSQGVSYLSSTVLPGEVGNSVMYGHNWPNLLGRLPQAQPGMQINIGYSDGSQKSFVISATATVPAKQIDIINPTTDIRLTIFTCTGFLDKNRFVVTAIPQ